MAKRKRLEIPSIEPVSAAAEMAQPRARMPIAEVAGDTAGRAALEDIAREMTAAEAEGRVVKKIPLAQIDVHHLSRDRMVLDDEEMDALVGSLKERGQQTPVEVLPLAGGRYGLISGMRRVVALERLGAGDVRALVRHPETARDAYRAMVEENEIRADLSFYERANLARAAVAQAVYPDLRAAVAGLFANAPAPKRSKISKFAVLCDTLGDALSYPASIPEHLGLALAKAIEDSPALAKRIAKTLNTSQPDDAAAERAVLEAALKRPAGAPKAMEILAPGVVWQAKKGKLVLSGASVDADLIDAVRALVVSRAKTS